MNLLLRIVAIAAPTSGTLLLWAAQVGPEDAVSNLAKWAKLAGIQAPPSWLVSQSADTWATIAGCVALIVGSLAIFLWWRGAITKRAAAVTLNATRDQRLLLRKQIQLLEQENERQHLENERDVSAPDPHVVRVSPELLTMIGELRALTLGDNRLTPEKWTRAATLGERIRDILQQFPLGAPVRELGNDLVQRCHIVMAGHRDHEDVRAERKEAEDFWAELYPLLTGTRKATSAPKIEILFARRAPFEVSDVQGGHVKSVVRIGIKNSGGGTVSNCKIYIDKISPETPYPGGFPVMLDGAGFTLRHDDPAKLLDIAESWSHHPKKLLRFNAPMGNTFGDERYWTDGSIVRTIAIKVEATECQTRATFRIWTADQQTVRMERVS